MIRCILLAALAVLPPSVSAVTFNVVAQNLYEANGTDLMRAGGLAVLVVSTQPGGFDDTRPETQLEPGQSLDNNSDDLVLAKWALPTPGSLGEQVYNPGTYGSVSGQWTAGDLFRLYWFPTLTLSDVQAEAGAPYGFFPNHDTGNPEQGDESWVTPVDTGLPNQPAHNLSFVTVNWGGPHPESRGVASYTIVPEPSFFAGLFAAGCFVWASVSKRKKSRSA